jgi:integrase
MDTTTMLPPRRNPTRRVTLNDRILKALKPAGTAGKPYDIRDTVVPGLRVRVMGGGQRTFVLLARYPGSPNPTRRALGEYGELTLAEARAKAQEWLALIRRGIDPHEQEERARLEEQQKRKNTFASVAEDFIAEKLSGERKGKEVERDLRRDFIPAWGKLPITDITDLHLISIVKAKKRTAPAQARNLLGHAKRLFTWAVDQRCYAIKASPFDSLKAAKIIGEKPIGTRVLSDDELFALWRAAGRIPYPYCPVYRLLMLTALRLNEVARANWSEFDLPKKVWVIPASRMKGRNSKARPHAVPLTPDIMAILESLPRFNRGKFLFSTSFGEIPSCITNQVKKRIDRRMLRTLRALARRRGDDPAAVNLQEWTNHDIRRSVRSNLSRLRIPEEAREALLAHVRPGIKCIYDHHDYFGEKREALELWAGRLRNIIEAPATNAVTDQPQVREKGGSSRVDSVDLVGSSGRNGSP